jgi:hypothetical protein
MKLPTNMKIGNKMQCLQEIVGVRQRKNLHQYSHGGNGEKKLKNPEKTKWK